MSAGVFSTMWSSIIKDSVVFVGTEGKLFHLNCNSIGNKFVTLLFIFLVKLLRI